MHDALLACLAPAGSVVAFFTIIYICMHGGVHYADVSEKQCVEQTPEELKSSS